MNKTIYMTYKRRIPQKVKDRWIEHNADYKIEFSLDKDCVSFLERHFSKNVSELFNKIDKGMFKADLWRICKLYENGGVYADVDLVPYLSVDTLDDSITFYSCLSIESGSIFQAFIANFAAPKHPLFLVFLLSFVINEPYEHDNGPTFDMYRCIKHILDVDTILPQTRYDSDHVKVKVCIGASKKNIKRINLGYFPADIDYSIILHETHHKDKFDFNIHDNYLTITRTDETIGWGCEHHIDICFPCKTSFFFFQEVCGPNNDWVASYVVDKGNKIFDSRDINYHNNGGW